MSSSSLSSKDDSSVAHDSSLPRPSPPSATTSTKKRRKEMPTTKKPPKRPKSLLQHRADLKKKEQRRKSKKLQKEKIRDKEVKRRAVAVATSYNTKKRKPERNRQQAEESEEDNVVPVKRQQSRHEHESILAHLSPPATGNSKTRAKNIASCKTVNTTNAILSGPPYFSDDDCEEVAKKRAPRRKANLKTNGMDTSASISSSSDHIDSDVQGKRYGRRRTASTSESSESSVSSQQDDDYRLQTKIKKKTPTKLVSCGAAARKIKKGTRRRAAMDSSSSDESCSNPDPPGEKQGPQRKRMLTQPTSREKTPAEAPSIHDVATASTSGPQQWTEVLAPCHVLIDEVRDYIVRQGDSLSEAEKTNLNEWVTNVQTELEQQNRVVLENIRLVTDLRKINRRRNSLQDTLLRQRREIQALKQEASIYQAQVEQTKEDQSTVASANQFLLDLQNLTQT